MHPRVHTLTHTRRRLIEVLSAHNPGVWGGALYIESKNAMAQRLIVILRAAVRHKERRTRLLTAQIFTQRCVEFGLGLGVEAHIIS